MACSCRFYIPLPDDFQLFMLSRSSGDVPEGVFKHTVKARDVAVRAVADAKRGRKRSICGAYNRLQVFVCTHMPRIASYVWVRSLR